ncbi:MAG: hypothetical protein IJD52_00495 [Alphaproteobacteria bacterium]|nr:hypothetical protein [Alphaproteobacteria bacterium]
MKFDTPTHCDGCDKHCEYGYFTRTGNGAIYPTIGTRIIQKYNTRDGRCIFIGIGELTSPAWALKTAHEIAQACRKHYQNQKTK